MSLNKSINNNSEVTLLYDIIDNTDAYHEVLTEINSKIFNVVKIRKICQYIIKKNDLDLIHKTFACIDIDVFLKYFVDMLRGYIYDLIIADNVTLFDTFSSIFDLDVGDGKKLFNINGVMTGSNVAYSDAVNIRKYIESKRERTCTIL